MVESGFLSREPMMQMPAGMEVLFTDKTLYDGELVGKPLGSKSELATDKVHEKSSSLSQLYFEDTKVHEKFSSLSSLYFEDSNLKEHNATHTEVLEPMSRRPLSNSKNVAKEVKLVRFMRKYAVDDHDMECVILCRYGEAERHDWKRCLERCIDKSDHLRPTFLKMLPDERHGAQALDTEMPLLIQNELKNIRSHKESHAEL